MKEIWKDIKGYEGLYQVSNLGNVKSLNYNRTGMKKTLKFTKFNNGYLKVDLCKNGKSKHMLIHRLVAQAFLDNPNNYIEVNHIDEDKTNNFMGNLEWCDRKYNTNYGTRNERASVSNTNNPKRSKKVYQYTLDGILIKEWESTNECGRNGYNQGHIAACCRNEYLRKGNNVYKGYIWTYKPFH